MNARDVLALEAFMEAVRGAFAAATELLGRHTQRIRALEKRVDAHDGALTALVQATTACEERCAGSPGAIAGHTERLNALCALRKIDQEAHRDLVMEVKEFQRTNAIRDRHNNEVQRRLEEIDRDIRELQAQINQLSRQTVSTRELAQAFESHIASWQHALRR
jgi:chromosome segregation ATPase